MPKIRRLPSCTTPGWCEIINHGSSTTLLAWKPRYDGDGNQLNHDPNRVESRLECLTCKKKWCHITQGEQETNIVESN